jgi:organic radical activating enzyme
MTYPLGPDGVYWSHQGEGHLRGFGMAFIRLAGCSVGCAQCDTNYAVSARLQAEAIAESADLATPRSVKDRWAWITGGEPTDHNLKPLIAALRHFRFSIAVATAGHKRLIEPVEWLSVSPHDPEQTVQMYGNEIKLVDGLHGLSLDGWIARHPDSATDFFYRYVQPMSVNGVEDRESLWRCKLFLDRHPNWALSRQDHLVWGVR